MDQVLCQYIYSIKYWHSQYNVARQILNIPDTTMSVSLFKNKLKKFLTKKQTLGDDINWIEHNSYPFLNS